MNYQLFLPGATANNQCLKDFNLDTLFVDGKPVLASLQGPETPTGESGVLVNYIRQMPGDAVTEYFAEWDWRKLGDYWFGTAPKSPPTPDDLIRKSRVPGFVMELLDGNQWMFPLYSRVEHAYSITDDAQMVKVPTEKHAEFFEKCLTVQHEIFAGLGLLDLVDKLPAQQLAAMPEEEKLAAVTVHGAVRLVAGALAINYRINADIALALELFNDELLGQAIVNIVELPNILATRDEKKTLDTITIPVG